jgi:hypothetical protein
MSTDYISFKDQNINETPQESYLFTIKIYKTILAQNFVWILCMMLPIFLKSIGTFMVSFWGATLQILIFTLLFVLLIFYHCSPHVFQEAPYNYMYGVLYTLILSYCLAHLNVITHNIILYSMLFYSLSLIPFVLFHIKSISRWFILVIFVIILIQWILYYISTILSIYSQYHMSTLSITIVTSCITLYTLSVVSHYEYNDEYVDTHWILASMNVYIHWIILFTFFLCNNI